ncbi:A disintegrin and metalloproteinase with thrombospondin motifs adt-1-like isoform X2 [Acropora millepora]|uniref:A disintegrin and metalloproteinase with thrombospondin motifs adt-1-like isoform X2 n=1 Tax=Acropora millepora TaxID=45264 RepID=UPI001CF52795|nr:A disintegrin and metalloproteinase with thrombospondin motifs adt-1-like isoform X2 [Acropora millepora]
MQYQHLLLSLLIFPALASALWPFSENVKIENDPDTSYQEESSYFNQCLDLYRCSVCYKYKQEGKCANYTNECRKTCTECKGPDIDHHGPVKCQLYKIKGYCDLFSFKAFKCQKTCGSCAVDGNWGKWSLWSACSKTCKQGKQSRQRLCNYPAPRYGGKKCEGPSSQEKICNENVSCPVDGMWGSWSQWSACSKTCKQGKYSRARKCDSPAAQYGGKKCAGYSSEVEDCNKDVPCPVDGKWGEWSKWGTCTKTCKQGKQSRTRVCNSPAPQYGGNKCQGDSSQFQDCNRHVPCPIDGNWGEWSKWGTCTKTCKQGKQSRTRVCNSPSPQYGGNKCQGDSSQFQDCNRHVPCPIDGNWGEWSKWGTCTKTCKQGKQSRTRVCNSPAPQYGGSKCQGDSSQFQDCNRHVPCPIDGNWGKWSEWSACSKTCKQGKQSRQRLCNYPAPRYGGKKCDGPSSQEQICNENVPCPVDGNWGKWSKWSECSKTCKQGTQTRKRECSSPAAQYGGKKCPGKSMETQDCNKNVPCPVNGNWAEWGAWTECSLTCGPGKQTRVRQCNNPAPAYGGKNCDGPFRQSGVCIKKKCPVDGNWGGWSSWSTCSKTCKQGQQWRGRKCNSPAPKYDGKTCAGEPKQIIYCNANVPCPVNGMWGSWTTWSACSQTCGYGVRERNRYCDNPKPAYNGTTCVGDGYQKIRCHAYYPCPINGNWTNWGPWTPCTKTCGSSYRKRSRSCANPPPQFGGNGCNGKNDQVERCTRASCDVYG